jgi:hypothetical protein
MPHDQRLKQLELYAWVGEDELGSGAMGLKQGMVPAGCVPLVSIHYAKLHTDDLMAQGRKIVDEYGHARYLCRFVFDAVVDAILP